MNRFKRMGVCLVIIYAVAGVLPGLLYAAPQSDRCMLIRVQIADRNELSVLLSMGLDIWEARHDGVVIRVTDNERKLIQESGFIVETITEDVYEYLETISKEQISLFAEPAPAKYHTYNEVTAGLIALEDSGVAQTYIIGRTYEGRDIWAVKISDNPSEDEGEPGALFMGCHHAREWISVEVPYYLAHYLVNNYQTDPEVKQLVDNCEIWIVPIVNPDGYVYTWTKDRLWRKNRRNNGNGTFGVDLNRNYGYMWGLDDGSSGNPSNWEYRGPSAFSEPETQAIRDLILANQFRITMSYHSYGQLLYSPWGYTLDPCPDDVPMNSMIYNMRELIQETSGIVYTPWAEWEEKYPVSGDTGDWPYGILGIYSFGAELRPETEAQGGFVLPARQILPTCEENLPAALYLISLSADNGGIENLTAGKTYGSIQLAINDANDGDEIVISQGLYQENILFKGKSLILRSKDPFDSTVVEATVIRGGNQWPVATFSSGEDESCVLDGLTFMSDGPSCIYCYGSSPLISRCTIINHKGFALDLHSGSEPGLVDCVIDGAIHGPAFFVDDDGSNDPGPGNPDISDPNEDGSAEHPFDSIQEAIDYALDKEKIVVLPGRYTGAGNRDIDFRGKILNVRSQSGPATCVIDCQGLGRGFNFHSGEGRDSVLEGFTIINGNGDNGGAISCMNNSSPTIRNCIFSNNSALGLGGAVSNSDSAAALINCTFHANTDMFGGGAVSNIAEGMIITNCILRDNEPGEIFSFGTINVTYSNISGGFEGQGNIDADPLFADADNGDYNLKSETGRWDPNSECWIKDDVTSPCIDAGDPNSDWSGETWPHGGRINMGAYGGTREASMSIQPQPMSLPRIAYIYGSDAQAAESFQSLLIGYGCSTTLVGLDEAPAAAMESYDLVIVGDDTEDAAAWRDPQIIPAIEGAGRPIIGMGEAGYDFFGVLGLSIGRPNGWHGDNNSIYVVDPNHPLFSTPYTINLPEDWMLQLYMETSHVGINLYPVPQTALALGAETYRLGYYPLVLEQNRYLLWGFTESPQKMTEIGKKLFINVVVRTANKAWESKN